jgi:single-stranded DNA-binding protein
MLKVNGCGEVAFPPEMKQSAKGDYLTFKVRSGKTLPDGRVIQAYTRCVMFGERAQVAAKRIQQGTVVSIEGELSTRKDDEGREWTSVRVSDLGVPSQDAAQQPKSDRGYWRDPNAQPQYSQAATPAPQYAQAQPPAQPAQGLAPRGNPYNDDGIPF